MAEILAANQITIAKVLDGADGEMSAEQLAQLNQASEDASQAKSDVANLEIGGRNYITKISDKKVTLNGITVEVSDNIVHIYGTNTKTDANYTIESWARRANVFEPEAVYTVSTTTPLPSGLYLGINTINSSGIGIQAASNSYFYCDGSKTSNTFTCTQDTNGFLNGFFGVLASCGTVDVTFKIKLEKGNRATDWTPAPEDVDAGIANAQTSANNAQTSADNAQEDIDNLEIGGRNLFLNTGETIRNNSYLVKTYKYANEPLEEGETYTATLCLTPDGNVSNLNLFLSQGNSRVATINVNGTSKQVISVTFTAHYQNGMTPDVSPSYGDLRIYKLPNDVTAYAIIHWFKIEKGNKATDWTPAPEDVQAEIDSIKNRVVIDDDSVDIVDSTGRLLASYGDKTEIYDRSGKAQVSLGATKSTISGFDIVPLDGGHDYFTSDWEASDGNFYRTWIRSADNTDLGQTWAFSTQMKNQNDGGMYGGFVAKSNGDTHIYPKDATGADAGAYFYVTKDNGIQIYPNKTVSNQPNLYWVPSGTTNLNRLCHTTWSASSEQIKDEIKSIENAELNPQNLYDVNVVQFKYKPDVLEWDDERYGKELIGFIIEDLNEKYPIAVDKADEYDSKTWNWNSAYMIPAMLKLIQEQHKEIEELKELMKGNK